MKKKIMIMSIAAALVMATVLGGTLASIRAKSDQGVSDINTKEVGISFIEDEAVPMAFMVETPEKYMPGETIEYPLYAVNSADNGYNIYVRATLYKEWYNENEQKVLDSEILDPANISWNQAESILDNWIITTNDAEQIVMYYRYPLVPGEKSANMIEGIKIDKLITNEYADKNVQITAYIDGVQANQAADAIGASWGVTVEFEDDGTTIKSVTE